MAEATPNASSQNAMTEFALEDLPHQEARDRAKGTAYASDRLREGVCFGLPV